jgi:tetratricopeptide (TPR) repeat protein
MGDVLDAYRADLTNAGKETFLAWDALWLQFGAVLQRAHELESAQRQSYLVAGIEALLDHEWEAPVGEAIERFVRVTEDDESSEAQTALCALALLVANDAEDAGAFAVATTLLDLTRALVGVAEFRLQGRLLSQQARILRKISELDVSLELYQEVEQLAGIDNDAELRARAAMGRAVIARIRGNYPEARRHFFAVLEQAPATEEIRDLHVYAYHGLLIAAAVARDFEAALLYGAHAVKMARTADHRAELLVNLSSVCQDVGQHRAALNGYLRALAETRLPRVRFTALGSAATAAARLGERHVVDELTRSGLSLMMLSRLDYEVADMLREFGDAWELLEDEASARRFREQAMARAQRGGFFEIQHRIEEAMLTRAEIQAPPAPLTADAMAVASRLSDGDSHDLLAAAISNAHD